MPRDRNCQIFIAKLPHRVNEKDLDRKFGKYGEIRNLQLKQGYAFIEYEDYRDAEYAIERMDNREWEGSRIVVQPSIGKRRDSRRDRDRGDRGDRDRHDDYDRKPFIKKRGPQAEDTCFNCGESGHWYNECRQPMKPKGQFYKEDMKCYKCGEKGHLQKDCKNGGKRDESKSRSRSNSRGRSSSGSRDRSRDRSREERRSKDRSRDRSRDRQRSRSRSEKDNRRSKRRSEEKPQSHSRSVSRSQNKNGDRNGERNGDRN